MDKPRPCPFCGTNRVETDEEVIKHGGCLVTGEGTLATAEHIVCLPCGIWASTKQWQRRPLEDALLEALRDLVKECVAEFTVDGDWMNDGLVSFKTVAKARAALALAEGRTEGES